MRSRLFFNSAAFTVYDVVVVVRYHELRGKTQWWAPLISQRIPYRAQIVVKYIKRYIIVYNFNVT